MHGKRNGIWIAVLGPDGSGKSTLISHLEREFKGTFRRTTIFHLMPGLMRRQASGGPVTDPHSKPPRSLPASLLKLLYYLLDYNLGYWLKVRPALVKSTLVLFDRYYDDLLVDPKRYRYGGPMWLARWLRRLILRPDLWLILDVPEEEILHRKQEVPLEEVRHQREGYRQLATELPNAFLLNGSLPPEEVAKQAQEIVLDYLHERYLAQRHLWFPKEKQDDLGWLESSLGARKASHGKPFLHLALPDGRGYLLPGNSRWATLQALSLYAPQKPRARLAKSLLRMGLKTGIARHLLPEVRLDLEELKGVLEEVFGRQDLSLAVSLGTPGPYRKPVLQVLTERGEALGYVKVGWNEQTKALVLNELRNLEYISSLQLPCLKAPEVLHSGPFGNRFILITAPAKGIPPRQHDKTSPILEVLQDLAQRTAKRAPFLESTFWSDLTSRFAQLEGYVPTYQQRILEKSFSVIESRLRTYTFPWIFRLGDVAPWNVFVDGGGSLQVIDLEYAKPEWLPGWDLFHFLGFSNDLQMRKIDQFNSYFESLSIPQDITKCLVLAYLIDLFLEWQMSWFRACILMPPHEVNNFRRIAVLIQTLCETL
jgi:thymidylate kinase